MTLAARASRIAVEARANLETERERNRREMPGVAALMDEWRGLSEFCRLNPNAISWGRFVENGKTLEWGERTADARVSSIPLVSCGAIAELQAKYGGRKWTR